MSAQIQSDGLYPEIKPYQIYYLHREEHQIYYEISGNPHGATTLFLHGGPGAGTSPRARRFFNPNYYRIVLMDQRGAGQSIPNASHNYLLALKNNTIFHLISDIEQLRKELGIQQWQLILGGSWGTTLAIAYAEKHPDRCKQLLLRGIFTVLPDEVDALFQDGTTANHYPAEWDKYINYIRETSNNWSLEKDNLLGAYWKRLVDKKHRIEAAKAFVGYELSLSHLRKNDERIASVLSTPEILIPFAALEVHYMLNGCFLRRGQLLDEINLIKDLRIHVIHGRNDNVCLPKAALRFFNSLKLAGGGGNISIDFIEAAGHSDSDQNIANAIREATDNLYAERM